MTQLVSTANLLPQVGTFAPTCPAFIAEQQIRFAAIELAEVSRSWRHVSITDTRTGVSTAVVPPFTAIHEIEFAEFNGRPLEPIQFTTFREDREGMPAYISQVSPDTVQISPFMEGLLRMSVFLKPRADICMGMNPDRPFEDPNNVIPDFFVSLHGNTLAMGALARIFAIPDEPWTDEGRASYYEREFIRKRESSFRANLRGQQRAKLRTRFRDM